MRIGRDVIASYHDWDDEEEDDRNHTYFLPRACLKGNDPEDAEMSYCRQWSIIATACDNVLQLFALPLGWRDPADAITDNFDQEDGEHFIPFYLSAKFVLPTGGVVRDVGFYSDDGKSSLSSGTDSGTGMEGCQKLGILFQDENAKIDLWMASYDQILWQSMPFESTLIHESKLEAFATWNLQPMVEGEDNDHKEDHMALFAQSESRGQ